MSDSTGGLTKTDDIGKSNVAGLMNIGAMFLVLIDMVVMIRKMIDGQGSSSIASNKAIKLQLVLLGQETNLILLSDEFGNIAKLYGSGPKFDAQPEGTLSESVQFQLSNISVMNAQIPVFISDYDSFFDDDLGDVKNKGSKKSKKFSYYDDIAKIWKSIEFYSVEKDSDLTEDQKKWNIKKDDVAGVDIKVKLSSEVTLTVNPMVAKVYQMLIDEGLSVFLTKINIESPQPIYMLLLEKNERTEVGTEKKLLAAYEKQCLYHIGFKLHGSHFETKKFDNPKWTEAKTAERDKRYKEAKGYSKPFEGTLKEWIDKKWTAYSVKVDQTIFEVLKKNEFPARQTPSKISLKEEVLAKSEGKLTVETLDEKASAAFAADDNYTENQFEKWKEEVWENVDYKTITVGEYSFAPTYISAETHFENTSDFSPKQEEKKVLKKGMLDNEYFDFLSYESITRKDLSSNLKSILKKAYADNKELYQHSMLKVPNGYYDSPPTIDQRILNALQEIGLAPAKKKKEEEKKEEEKKEEEKKEE